MFQAKQGEFMGLLIYNELKSLPQDQVCQVNGETGESNTVREVLSLSLAVASGLNRLGVGLEDIVAIVGDYSPNTYATTYGCIFNGSPPFPMDPTMKTSEFIHMFKLSKPKVVIVNENKVVEVIKALDSLNNKAPVFVLYGDVHGTRAKPFECLLNREVNIEEYKPRHVPNPAKTIMAVLPSSGTTGMPKGVAISHSASIFQNNIMKSNLEIFEGAFAQTTPIFWISGFMLGIFATTMGFQKIYFNDITPEKVLPAIEKYKIGWAMFAPIYMEEILRSPLISNCDLSSLHVLAIGGSALTPTLAKLLKEHLPHVTSFNGYGTTETAGTVTDCFVTNDILSVGKIKSYASIKIVSPNTNKEVNIGEEGEVWVKTPTLMLRYLSMEEDAPNPIDEDGFYHTGDIGYVTEDGFVYLTGRIKELLKVKNHQVSPVELESAILSLEGVKDVAVVGIPHPTDQYHPRALVVKTEGSNITEKEVIEKVLDQLSETKQLYGGVQFVSKIPRSTTGKIKRRELLALVQI